MAILNVLVPNRGIEGTGQISVAGVSNDLIVFQQSVSTGETLRLAFSGNFDRDPFQPDNVQLIEGSIKSFSLSFDNKTVYDITKIKMDWQDLLENPTIPEVFLSKSDRITGTSGDDKLYGGAKADVLKGLKGDDLIDGGTGSDTIKAGGGSDDIVGGKGNDVLIGGGGRDSFIFAGRHGSDRIKDFDAGTDVIEVKGKLEFEDVSIRANGDDAIVAFGKTVVRIKDVDASEIGESDFIF